MDYWRREQVGAASGVASVILMGVGAAIVGSYPAPEATNETIARFLAENKTELRWQAFLLGAGIAVGIWFLGSVRAFLRRAEGGTGRLSAVAYGAGVSAGVAASFAMLLAVAPATRLADDPALAAGIFRISGVALAMAAFPMGVFAAATTLVIVRTNCLHIVTAYLGTLATSFAALGTLALFRDSGALAPGGTLAFYGPFVSLAAFIAVTSVLLVPVLQQPADSTLARRRISDIAYRAEPMPARRASDGERLEARVIDQRRSGTGE